MEFRSRTCRILIALMFMATILIIPLATLFNLDRNRSESEKRALAILPRLKFDCEGFNDFPLKFEQFFNDRFVFRQQLVYLNSLLRVGLLHTSSNDKVVVGKDGWLFYADEHALAVDLLSPALLELWRVALEAKRDWLAVRGIEYVFMVAPEKHTIYPEHLPRSHRPQGLPSNLDRLIEYLQRTSSLRVLDVRQRLLSAKSIAPVFYQTDTHWNSFGAAIACENLLGRLAEQNPSVTPLAVLSRPVRQFTVPAKDMAAMLLLKNQMSDTEVVPGVPVVTTKTLYTDVPTSDGLLVSISENHVEQLPNAVVFHDSFFNNMNRYFVQHFGRVVMVGGGKIHKFEQEIIEREHPEVVVEEIVERYLTGAPNVPQDILMWYQKRSGKN